MTARRPPRPPVALAHLRACPACSRHVRVTEEACPFCGERLDAAFRATPAPPPIPLPLSVRLSRAALVALGTGTLSLAAACGAATAEPNPPVEDGGEGDTGASAARDASEAFDAGIAPPDGVAPPPPFDAGAFPPPVDASRPDVVIAPPYGAPIYGQAPVDHDE